MTNIYDAIKEKENQIAIFQAQISGLQFRIAGGDRSPSGRRQDSGG
jgi:hypothetical protein